MIRPAAILARLDAIEATMAAPLPAKLDQVATAVDQVTPSGEVHPKGAPAHERAIRRAWAERRAARLQRLIAADHMRMREQVQEALRESMRAEARKGERIVALKDKRRRAVLKARDLQSRLYAEHRLVDQANERRRKARDDWRNTEARLATVTRERDSAHVALQAVTARAERAEGALGAVGERLAAVEGVIQQRTA